jgi:hypothetical protein
MMMKSLFPGLTFLFLASVSTPALAQDYEYHPALSDRFSATVGWMRSNNSFKAEAEGLDDPDGTYIDFQDSLGVDGHSTLFNGQVRFKFGSEQKWSVFGQYFNNSANGEAVLTEDIEWDGDIFREGSEVGAGVKMKIWRLFFGRSLFKNKRNDFGIGAGIHNLDVSLYVEGNVAKNDGVFEYTRDEVGGSQILPNIGAWYNFSPARRWLIHARVDWISADIGDYDGTLWNTTLGVNFQAWRHVGFDLYWQYFNLNGGAEKDDWRGRVDMTYSGPVVAVTFTW